MNASSIPNLALYPVTATRLHGEPGQHVIMRLTASDGTMGGFPMCRICPR